MPTDTEIIERINLIAARGSASDVIAEATKYYKPLFIPQFESIDDAKRFWNKIPYKNRLGTISIIIGGIILESGTDGFAVVTGGNITNEETTQLIGIIRDKSTNQKGCPIIPK